MCVDVVIVSFNTKELIQKTIEEVKTWNILRELTVIDNASIDGTRDWLENDSGYTYILNDENKGFATAANQGAFVGVAPYILFLNPDLVFPEDQLWLDAMLYEIEAPNVQVVSPRLVSTEGVPWPGSKEWVTGACMLVRRAVFEDLGGFDEEFFLGYEDRDFCFRVREEGWFVQVAEDIIIVHDAMKSPREFGAMYHPHSQLHFYDKWVRGRHKQPGEDFGSVAVACTYGKQIPGTFIRYWTTLLMNGLREDDMALYLESPTLVHWGRDAIARSFLESTECDTLLFVDTDMGFDHTLFHALRDNPENFEYGIVSGLCVSRSQKPEPLVLREEEVPWPMTHNGVHFERRVDFSVGRTIEVDGTGMAFTLVRRCVLESMIGEAGWNYTFFFPFEKRQGEDVTFCLKAREAGFKIGVDTRVQPGHFTEVPLTWEMVQHGFTTLEKLNA